MEKGNNNLVHERLAAVEGKCAEQQAQIDALVSVVSDLLAAHVVLHDDLRPCSFLREYRLENMRADQEGGTSRIPASYFSARANLFADVLNRTALSRVFEEYWFRSLFWRNEERQRVRLDKIRKSVEGKSDS